MDTLKDLKIGDHVLLSRETSINDIPYTSYEDMVVSNIMESGIIVLYGIPGIHGGSFDPTSGLECGYRLHHCRRHIVMENDEQALNMMKEYRKAKTIFDISLRMHSCLNRDLTYEQAIKIAEIMGWKI